MNHQHTSLGEVHQSVDTTVTSSGRWKKMLAFFGPAYLVSVGYMDPGNWATDLAGGSQYGYTLLWVLLMSNLMALLLQSLSARLGIVRGRDLAQANRETYPPGVNFILYILAEIAIAATDLAEVLGMAIGIQLLTGLPLQWGVSITVFDTFLLLVLQRYGIRKMEAFIIALVAIVGLSFLTELIMAKPVMSEVVTGFVPRIPDNTALYIAIGIIGATVMPHNLYLHSALVQTRKIRQDEAGIKQALRLNFIDSAIALNLAFFVNAAILILAAAVFFKSGQTNVAEIQDAHKLLEGLLSNKWAPILFAIALIAAGQSSTVTGTLAGQIVMEGYLKLRINPWLRRLLTRLLAIVPALLVIQIAGADKVGELLVFSQVLLSLQLGFAVIPLIHFVSDKKTMGKFAVKVPVKILSWLITVVLVYLNTRMVFTEAMHYMESGGSIWVDIIISVLGIGFVVLLFITVFYPLATKYAAKSTTNIHPATAVSLENIKIPQYNRIALALDFSRDDEAIIANAIAHGNEHTRYLLIHIVESASARYLGGESDDLETRKDKEQMETYVRLMKTKNLQAEGFLGYRHRAEEIVRIVKAEKADFLVLGGHGHTGIKDWIYGETTNQVRHKVKIPVLVVQ
ncbi:Nramp family divalent metal transporter [Chitinophaga sancti]|uniref:Divalent metal cation transporter MntH n=1 Tax=Chitinophaga sancti TaxID=1004 RepID=A0A1K1QIZ0_9BACT|nr:Nramp family divalent metal transporter [Chitinophaga sancti]WQD65227.1 Nramp family divalent metal transporter [Chitinophaga sancti]WQG89149.1 Nramp family divalent metal transporter [Chitinophaga sancti]SFW59741.1 manganese transport protein [Chitinophaga sancti]